MGDSSLDPFPKTQVVLRIAILTFPILGSCKGHLTR